MNFEEIAATPPLSWPANAGHPVDAHNFFAGLFLSNSQTSRKYHLGGPHLRAMTLGGCDGH